MLGRGEVDNMPKYKIGIIAILLCAMVVPAFRPTTALSNLINYMNLRKEIVTEDNTLNTSNNTISSLRKKINGSRDNKIDAEDANAVYKAAIDIAGITSKEAKVISINQDTTAIVGDFDPNADNSKIDGIQLTIYASDIKAYITELSKLNLPYEVINAVYPENKVVIKFNTKGGLV